MAGNFFRGTTAEQDSRWGGDRALMKKMEKMDMFSKTLDTKVNMVTTPFLPIRSCFQ
jgi:hypothetical protein